MNDTNNAAIPYLEQILRVNDAALGLPALPLVFFGCIMFGFVLKSIPPYPNRWIPAGNFAFGVVANLLVTPVRGTADVFRAAILGMIAAGLAWVAHRKFISRWIADKDFASPGTAFLARGGTTATTTTPAPPAQPKETDEK